MVDIIIRDRIVNLLHDECPETIAAEPDLTVADAIETLRLHENAEKHGKAVKIFHRNESSVLVSIYNWYPLRSIYYLNYYGALSAQPSYFEHFD